MAGITTILSIGFIVLGYFIFYLIIKVAVRNGTKEALAEQNRQIINILIDIRKNTARNSSDTYDFENQ